jgi:hypothetical protein
MEYENEDLVQAMHIEWMIDENHALLNYKTSTFRHRGLLVISGNRPKKDVFTMNTCVGLSTGTFNPCQCYSTSQPHSV